MTLEVQRIAKVLKTIGLLGISGDFYQVNMDETPVSSYNAESDIILPPHVAIWVYDDTLGGADTSDILSGCLKVSDCGYITLYHLCNMIIYPKFLNQKTGQLEDQRTWRILIINL